MFCPICKKYNEKLKKEIEMEKVVLPIPAKILFRGSYSMHILMCPVCSFWLPCSDYGVTLEKLMDDI